MTVQFPVPSETFATNEVRTLIGCGVEVAVHGLRPRHKDHERMLRDRGIPAGTRVTHNSMGATLRGVAAALRRPRSALNALAWVLRVNASSLRDLAHSLAILPRAFDILADLERDPPHVVHMYWGHYPTLVGYLVQRRLPSTVTSMSMVAYDLVREYKGAIEVARRADVVRTHARVNAHHIARFTGIDPLRIQVIYNGVDIEWAMNVIEGRRKVPRRIMTAGRLSLKKGMEDVLFAFAQTHARWPDATLVIAGEGPDRERLVATAQSLGIHEAVQFIGHVRHERVLEEMAQAEVFMLLSRADGERLPNVVKEGMICGCVCVTTPTPGISELVEHGVTGFVVPGQEVRSVSDLLGYIFSGTVDAAQIAQRARDRIRTTFDLRRTAPQYAQLWRSAIAERATAAGRGGGEHGPHRGREAADAMVSSRAASESRNTSHNGPHAASGQAHPVTAAQGAPRVSVVIPTFRRPTFLVRAIASVRAQTLESWEMVVVDDNDPASDYRAETEAIMHDYATDERIQYAKHARNCGGSAARNTGIQLARGQFVAFLDDDDEWHPEKLERQVACLEAAPADVALAYCRTRIVHGDGATSISTRADGISHQLREVLKRNSIGSTSCVVCRRDALLEVGGFDEALPSKQDIDLYVRLAERFRFVFVDATLLTLHRHDEARVGRGVDSAIRAHEHFHAKYWHLIERFPDVLHYRLVSLGDLLLRAGRRAEARAILWRAWKLRPTSGATIVRLGFACGLPLRLATVGRHAARMARGQPLSPETTPGDE